MIENLMYAVDAQSFAFSPENPTGERSGGSRGGDCTKLRPLIKIQPGETATLVDIDGEGVIQSMWFGNWSIGSYILRIYWEGNKNPSVEVPLGAFFGCNYDKNFSDRDGNYPVFNSAVMAVAPARGLNCYFPMPFKKKCRITIENRSKEEEWLYYIITGCKKKLEDEIAYFHASYRQAYPVEKGKAYTVIDGIKGKGHFIGVMLAVGLNGANNCWVEGEARMYIDGDKYPTIHYTGTEDYFGGSYAFGNDHCLQKYQTYSNLYTGLFSVMGSYDKRYNNQQRFLLYRFHVADPIYFNESFRMTLDNLGGIGPRYDDYATVAYWYQTLPFAELKSLPTDVGCL